MKIINRFNMLSDAIQDHHRTWGSVFLVDKDIAPLQVPAQPRTPNPTKGALLNRGKPISPSMSESLSFIRHLQTINNPLAFFLLPDVSLYAVYLYITKLSQWKIK